MVRNRTYFSCFVFVFCFFVLLAGLLSACSQNKPQAKITFSSPTAHVAVSPTATRLQLLKTVQPTQVPATPTSIILTTSCLVGSWTIADLPQAISDSYSRSQSSLQLMGVQGDTFYTFHEDGSMEIVFNNLIASLAGTIEGKEIKARNLMFGTATAQYRVNEKNREIVFSVFGGDGIQFATEINGQVLAQGNFPTWRAFSSNLAGSSPNLPIAGPTRVVSEAYAAIVCSGDDMRLQAIDPIPGPEVKLRRVVD